MSDFDLPNLPSDEDLGLSKEEIAELEKEFGDTGPEMSDAEMAALLGESPPPQAAPAAASQSPAQGEPSGGQAADSEPDPKVAKTAAKAAAKQAKAEAKRAAKEQKAQPPGEETPRPANEDGPRTKWRGPATLVLLLLMAFVSSSRTGLPRPRPANAPGTEFSSARAMTMLVDIAKEAHPSGSPYHAVVRQYVVDRLTSMGLKPETQTTTSMIQGPTRAQAATVHNVVVRIPGTASTGAVLATAHYDSREISRGAGDDGSGVVSLLEAYRAIQAGEPLQNDLILLFTDAEELGLLGARAFVDEHPWMADVRVALSFEMRGGAGPAMMFETNNENGWVVGALKAGVPSAKANSMGYEVYQRMPNDTDFTPFREAGIQGLNFAGIDNAHVYHQEYDTPENFSETTLQHQGLNALGSMRYMGNQDLTTVDAPNAVYLSLPVLGLVVYAAKWVTPISGVLLVLLVLALVLVRTGGWGYTGTLVGVVTALVGGGLAVGATVGLTGWLASQHPELGSLHGSAYHREGWYIVALVAASFAIVTALHGIARRRFRWQELTLGAAIVPVAAAVALGQFAPLAAMNLQLPAAAALVALIVALVLAKNADGVVGWVIAMAFALPVVAIMEPLTEFLWIAMSIQLGTAIVGLAVVALYCALPALDSLRHPNSWWAPVTGVVVAASALGLGLLGARPSAERPAPSTLVYAYEYGEPQGLWATEALTDSVDAPAYAWAAERVGAAFGAEQDLTAFGYVGGDVPVAPAPVVDAAPPFVTYESDETVDGTRRVTLALVSQIGAEMLRFTYPVGGRTRLIALNGRRIDDPEALQWAQHWGTPDPAVFLTLEMPEGADVELNVIEHLLRPEELLGADAFARPSTLAPNINRMSDRAMLLSSIRPDGGGPEQALVPSETEAREESTAAETPDGQTLTADTVVTPDTTVVLDSTAAPDATALPTNTIGR
jgi:hypothetical protein